MEYFPSLGLSIFVFILAAYVYQKYQPPPKPSIVGIDLGTTYSSIATFHSVTGAVDIYEIENSSKSIPSQIYFGLTGVHVGYSAQQEAINDAENLLYDGKRFIGKNLSDDELNYLKQYYSFDLQNIDGRTLFKLTHNNARGFCGGTEHPSHVSAECLAALILAKLVKAASSQIKRTISKAVIAVPADFNEAQEKATIRAAKMAGITILRVITEPTAAALSYGLHHRQDLDYVLVIDVGGGTTDVSLLRLQGGMFFVHGLSGNNRLGGQDFNDRLLEHLEGEISSTFGTEWHLSRREDLQTLKLHVERAKLHVCSPPDHGESASPLKPYFLSTELHLSSNDAATPSGGIKSSTVKKIFEFNVTRQLFDSLNAKTYSKILETVGACLEGANLQAREVDEVVLVGGSTRIRTLREAVRRFFPLNTTGVHYSSEPELAVVKGVAIMAGIVGGAWPLTISAIEPPPGPDGTRTTRYARKINVV